MSNWMVFFGVFGTDFFSGKPKKNMPCHAEDQ